MTGPDPIYVVVDGHTVPELSARLCADLIDDVDHIYGSACPHERTPTSRQCPGCRETAEYVGTGLRECAGPEGACGCGEEE